MAKENRQNYQIPILDLSQLNFVLGRIADRLDELEGRRGTPAFKSNVDMGSNKITTLGQGLADSDALRKDQIDDDTASLQQQITAHGNNISNPHSVTHSQLSDKGTNDHAAIDTHIANTGNPHSVSLNQARVVSNQFSGAVEWLDESAAVIHKFS